MERQIKHLSVPFPLLPFPPRYPWEMGCYGVGERRPQGWPCTSGTPVPPGGAGKPPPPRGTSPARLRGDRCPSPGPAGSWAACSGLSAAGNRRACCWTCVWCRGPPAPPSPPSAAAPAAATPGGAARPDPTGPPGSCAPRCLRSRPPRLGPAWGWLQAPGGGR